MPALHRRPEAPPPVLDGQNKLQSIKNHWVEDAHDKVVRIFEIIHQPVEFGDRPRGGHTLLFELRLKLEQPGAREFFPLKSS